MIEEKLMAEILKTHRDSQFGYTTVNCPIYYRHVNALLEERKELLDKLLAANFTELAEVEERKGKNK